MRRAVVVAALASVVVWPIQPAESSQILCFGKVPTYIGTHNRDVVSAMGEDVVLHLRGGNDEVWLDADAHGPIFICTGSGNDVIWAGGALAGLDGGSGQDSAHVTVCGGATVRRVETVDISPGDQDECH